MNFLFTFKHGNFTMHYETRIQFKCSYVLFPDTIPGKKHLCRAFETIFYKLKFTTSFFVCARMLRNNDTRLPTIDDYDMITDYTIIQCTITQLYRLYNYIPHNNTFILIIHRGLHSQQNCTITQTSNLNAETFCRACLVPDYHDSDKNLHQLVHVRIIYGSHVLGHTTWPLTPHKVHFTTHDCCYA